MMLLETAAGRFWMMGLQACVLILVVLAARIFMRKYPRVYSYSLWGLVLFRLLCPVWVESPFSLQADPAQISGQVQEWMAGRDGASYALPESGAAASGTALPDNEGKPQTAGDGASDLVMMGDFGQTEKFPGESFGGEEDSAKAGRTAGNRTAKAGIKALWPGFRATLPVIWLAGTVLLGCCYLLQYIAVRRLVFTAVRSKDNVWICDEVSSPFVMGVFRPRIYLPAGMGRRERRYVLMHERMHIKHHDPVVRLLGILCTCFHWWNPFVWLAVHVMNQDMEVYCDEAIFMNAPMAERKAYAYTLLAFAQKQSGLSVGLAFGESDTENRVKNILKKKKRSRLIGCAAAVLAVFCVAAFLTIPLGTQQGENTDPSGQNGTNFGENGAAGGAGAIPEGNGASENETQDHEEFPAEENANRLRREKYQSVLKGIYEDQVFPDGTATGGFEEEGPSDSNCFAVYDVDQDGKEELIVLYDNGIMAGKIGMVYEYDPDADALREELWEFVDLTFYENGLATAGASHNQGYAGGNSIWPYYVYRHNAETDQYEMIGNVDAWDKSITDVSRYGFESKKFPDAVDQDGDGIVYFLLPPDLSSYDVLARPESEYRLEDYVADRAEFEQSELYMKGNELQIPYVRATKENIEAILKQ